MEFLGTHSTTSALPASLLLVCELCDKPFTRGPQYKRHLAYCRKARRRTRPRSCQACNEAKIKCNHCDPCQQCIRKGIKCLYTFRQPPVRSLGHSHQPSTVVTADLVPFTNDTLSTYSTTLNFENIEQLGDNSCDFLTLSDPTRATELEQASESSMVQYSTSAENPALESSSSITTLSRVTTVGDRDSSESYWQASYDGNDVSFNTDFLMADFDCYGDKALQVAASPLEFTDVIMKSPIVSIQSASFAVSPVVRSLSPRSSLVHFSRKKMQTSKREAFLTIMVDMIHAYPRMMMRRETLPPFIHAYSPMGEFENQDNLHEHLKNCMGIAQLFAAHSHDTNTFVWTTIWAEMRGFRKKLNSFSRYGVTAALQACLMYLIIRVVDSSTQNAQHDFEMIKIYEAVVERYMVLCDHTNQRKDQDVNIEWTEWILAQTGSRIACVWLILGLVYHLRTGTRCFVSEYYRDIPLPCTKTEWEAKTESDWRIEHETAMERKRRTTLNTFGDLIDAHQQRERYSEELDVWNAGNDHLGVLLNLAVHLFD